MNLFESILLLPIAPAQVPSIRDLLSGFLSGSDEELSNAAAKGLGALGIRFPEQIAPELLARTSFLRGIRFQDGGDSPQSSSLVLEGALTAAPPFKPIPFQMGKTPKTPEPKSIPSLSDLLTQNGLSSPLQPHSWHGRTLVSQDKNGSLLALKFQKEGEDPSLLSRELQLLEALRRLKKSLGLRSDYPEPVTLVRLPRDQLPLLNQAGPHSKEPIQLAFDRQGQVTALVYRPSPDYLTYLNDSTLREANFQSASNNALHDLGVLARHGLFHTALIDLFHNLEQRGREDRGVYLWMVDLVRPMVTRSGAGRLHGWLQAVSFPNPRASGLADLADLMSLQELLTQTEKLAPQLNGLLRYGEKAPNFFLASYLGDYLLAYSLILGSRLRERGELNWNNDEAITRTANQLQAAASHLWEGFTGQPPDRQWLEETVDWKRLARQMHFFMSAAYVSHFAPEKGDHRAVPDGIYDPRTLIRFGHYRQDTWDPKKGFIGHHGDLALALGPVNGPNPIQEQIRANYLLSFGMVAALQSPKPPPGQGAGPSAGLRTGLEEVVEAAEGISATPVYGGVEKGILPILSPGTHSAVPVLAGMEEVPFVVLVDSRGGLEEVKALAQALSVPPSRYRVWLRGVNPARILERAAGEFPDTHPYWVDARPGWLTNLLAGLEETGILPVGDIAPAIEASRRHLQSA